MKWVTLWNKFHKGKLSLQISLSTRMYSVYNQSGSWVLSSQLSSNDLFPGWKCGYGFHYRNVNEVPYGEYSRQDQERQSVGRGSCPIECEVGLIRTGNNKLGDSPLLWMFCSRLSVCVLGNWWFYTFNN